MENYIGNIYTIFYELLLKKDGLTAPEKFAQIEKTAKKKFYDMTEQELYTAIEEYVQEVEDKPFETEEEFVGFVDTMINGESRKLFVVGKYTSK